MSISEEVRNWWNAPVLTKLKNIEEKLMAQLDDLKAGEDQIDVDIKALVDQDKKSFADLQAAVDASKTGTDLQPFIDQLKASHTVLAQALVDSQTADATTKPPTP